MKKIKKTVITIIFILLTAISVWPEEIESEDIADLINYIGSPVRINTVQRGNFQGILTEVNDKWAGIIGKDGQILFIDIESVESYIVFTETIEKDTFFQDSASNRLIIIPTGFPMETGEFHVADQEIAAVTMSYGLNEHISFWSGISIPGFVLNARYIASLSSSFAVSSGFFAGISWFKNENGTYPGVIIPYIIASWGEPNNNITLGVGPGISFNWGGEQIWDIPGIVGVIGGKKILTSSTSLIFENWIIWGKRKEFGAMEPVSISETLPAGSYNEYRSPVPTMIFPAVCFRIAGARLSWDIGAVVPLFISNDERVLVDAETEDVKEYYRNIPYKLSGFDEFIVPVPILSVTYRID